jgi:hypothetical protein
VEGLEKLCQEMSSKEVKSRKQDNVKFAFKEKGKKPIVTKDILQFSITGADFNLDKLAETLTTMGVHELE